MSKKVKVILVGYGRMGKNHFRVIRQDPRFELAAVVDPDFSKGAPLELEGTTCFADLKGVSRELFDCAIVASPTATHHAVIEELCGMQKDIFIEKPLAASERECRAVIERARQARIKVFVGHIERFNPAVTKVREILTSGALGRPIHFSFTRVGGYPSDAGHFNNVLLDLAVHDLDLLIFLSGETTVRASVCHSTWQPGIYDTAEILLAAESGVSASVHCNWITPTKIRNLRITGTKGVCSVDYILQTCTLFGGTFPATDVTRRNDFSAITEAYRNSMRTEFPINKEEPLIKQLNALYDALQGQTGDLCTAEQAVKSVALAEQAIRDSEKYEVTNGNDR